MKTYRESLEELTDSQLRQDYENITGKNAKGLTFQEMAEELVKDRLIYEEDLKQSYSEMELVGKM